MNATVLPEKQEERRNPKADGDGFMARFLCSSSSSWVLVYDCVALVGIMATPSASTTLTVIVKASKKIQKEEFFWREPAGSRST